MRNVYQTVTDTIVAALEAGTRPWQPRWQGAGGAAGLPLRECGKAYQGINVPLLWLSAADRGYSAPHWLTYKKAQELGGQVRKGERGTTVVFASQVTKHETVAGEERSRSFGFLKSYSVFNAEQIDGLSTRFLPAPVAGRSDVELNRDAEAFFADIPATVRHGGNRAYYCPSTDSVHLPEVAAFVSGEAYQATKAHEFIHWTCHKSRLDRLASFAREDYAREELVAEIGAAFLCATLGISSEPRDDHASYLASWIKAIKGDSRLIVQAASKAQAACAFLQSAAATAVQVAA